MRNRTAMIFIWVIMAGLIFFTSTVKAGRRKTLPELYGGRSVQELYTRGVQYLEARDYYSAVTLLEMGREKLKQKQVTDNIFRADLYAQLARAYYEQGAGRYRNMGDAGSHDQAIAYAQQSLEYNPGNWRANLILARISRHRQQFEQADYYYNQAEQSADPADTEAMSIAGEYSKFKAFKDRIAQQTSPEPEAAGPEAGPSVENPSDEENVPEADSSVESPYDEEDAPEDSSAPQP